jgi:hypothetical protein
MTLRRATLVASFLLLSGLPAYAQSVSVQFQNGYVTLKTQNAPLPAILAEWSRVGGSRIINAEQVPGTPLTLELSGVTERQALSVLLRSVSGYITAPRRDDSVGASTLDRILILPTSTPVRQAAATPAATATRTAPPDVFVPGDGTGAFQGDGLILGGDAEATRLQRNSPELQQQIRDAAARAAAARDEADGVDQGDAEDEAPTQPGRLRRPGNAPANPFGNVRGASRPGEITPAPQR